MYEALVILLLLAAATSGFPVISVDDHDTIQPSEFHSITKGKVPLTEYKLKTVGSENLNELMEESAIMDGKLRKTRQCILTIAGNCSENGLNSEVVLRHLRRIQEALMEHAQKTNRRMIKLMFSVLKSAVEE